MSLFAGYARQVEALPRAAAPAPPPTARGLFGGTRRPREWGGLQTFLMGTDARDEAIQRQRQEEELRQRTMVEDRLRAALSPMDTAAGPGTGALPGIEQQMAALEEARLLNPQVAEQFAPVVQSRQAQAQAQNLFADDPRAAALWMSGNEEFRNANARQYAPMAASEGTAIYTPGTGQTFFNERRAVVGDKVVGMGTNTLAPRQLMTVSPSFDDLTQRYTAESGRITATRPQAVTTGTGAVTTLIGSDGTIGEQIQGPAPVAGANAEQTVTQAKDASNVSRLVTSGRLISQFEENGFDFGLGAVTGGQLRGDFRAYESAAREWTDAHLRLTTGAQAPESEIVNAMRTYFPQPGDDENVRRQKAQMRADAEAANIPRAGPGWSPPPPRGPQPGQIEDGYQFLGGDPANPSSWRRVQ